MSDIPPKRAVTIRDVAVAAGVHQSTVSRALQGDKRIREEVRTRIAEYAERLQYRPNPYVSAFVAQIRSYRNAPKGAVLALLECHKEELHQIPYRVGAERRAQDHGFKPEVFRLHELDFSFERLNKLLWTRSIRGLLVLPVKQGFDLSELDLSQMAAATVDPSLHAPILHRACPDYFQGMKLALEVLASRGYRRVTFCTSQPEIRLLDENWLGAFTGVQAPKKISQQVPPYIGDTWKAESFPRWFKKFRPDAIIANSHVCFQHCHEMGFLPPEVANVTLNAGPDYPGIAGISQNPEDVGAAAVDMILAQIHRNEFGLPKMARKLLIQSSWIDGETVRGQKREVTDGH